VEAKGTTGSPERVFLSVCEVEYARSDECRTDLLIVSGVELHETASGCGSSGGGVGKLRPKGSQPVYYLRYCVVDTVGADERIRFRSRLIFPLSSR